MYPGNGPVRERWFRPAALAGALSESGFEDVRIAYLLGKDEARSPVFHWFPQTRLMTLWTARTTDLQGGDLG